MKKIVINNCFGKFSLSALGTQRYYELKGIPCYFYDENKNPVNIEELVGNYSWTALKTPTYECINSVFLTSSPEQRDDLHLIQVVEELGHKADGYFASLKIVKIPDDVKWEISEYDGNEGVEEQHRKWF